MLVSRTRLLVVACLLLSASPGFAPPALSEESSEACTPFRPAAPSSESKQAAEAANAEVLSVRKDASKKTPLTVKVELGTSIWSPTGAAVVEDTEFVNLQVATKDRGKLRLNARVIWDSKRQLDDIDLFIYDSDGREMSRSNRPTGQPQTAELVSVPAKGCEGFTVEVRGYRTLETTATLQVWLSKS